MPKSIETEALQKAIDIVGSQSALARSIKVSQQNVWYWLNHAGRVPAEFVIPIVKATKGKVKRHMLRPDLYPVSNRATFG